MSSPLVSIFTPSHDPIYLDEAYSSVLSQTYENWEWIILLNNNDKTWAPKNKDDRIKIYSCENISGVGALKKLACSYASGDYLVELDHDDVLISTCLEELVQAFEDNPSCGFVYSCTAQIDADGNKNDARFNALMGWTYEDESVDGKDVSTAKSFSPYPSTVSYIWFAPNHVRAFRKDTYDQVGGYDESLDILDDQDIICRMYQAADFHQINHCLYLQRVHDKNTQKDAILNQRIQQETVQLYDKYIEKNALAWCERNNLVALDLGAAHSKPFGYLGVDKYDGEGVDIIADITNGIDLPDNSVGVIRAIDFLEHIPDKVAVFNEMYRLLAHGGMILSSTPSTDGRGAFQDPTHVAFYNENSFWYFTNEFYAKYVPEITCKFQVSRMLTYYPSEWHEYHKICYVRANLVAVKDGPRIAGELLYS
jgi:glycosyltransferase involved in cell wall biosynthesis